MRLKRFKGKVRRVVRKKVETPVDLLAEAEALHKEGAGAQGFLEGLRALMKGVQRRWEALSLEEREQLLSQIRPSWPCFPRGGLAGWAFSWPRGQSLGRIKRFFPCSLSS
ncbi:hypothetical protein TthSNM66_03720 [Thermus thermophilus]|nr:hypothetical protein TthSNM66_03720 [Thermus thermophilus]BDG28170.1 hypothetical protein TthSNM76_03800 [Thermus thermophilus]